MEAGAHVPWHALDLLLIGDMPAAEAERARRHIQSYPLCSPRWAELQREAAEFDTSVYPRTVARAAPAARAERRGPRAWLAGALAGAAMAVVLIFVARVSPTGRQPHQPVVAGADFVAKGGAIFLVFARRGDGVTRVADGERMSAGDQVRFVAEPGGYPYLIVGSIDAARHATIYFPYGGARSGRVDESRRFEAPSAITLDGTPGPERIFALFSRQPIAAAEVTTALARIGNGGPEAIRQAHPLAVPSEAQTSILIEK